MDLGKQISSRKHKKNTGKTLALMATLVLSLTSCKIVATAEDGGRISQAGNVYTAVPEGNYDFVEWSGWRECGDNKQCEIDIPEYLSFLPFEVTITASFKRRSFFDDKPPEDTRNASNNNVASAGERSSGNSTTISDFYEVEEEYETAEVLDAEEPVEADPDAVDLQGAVEMLKMRQGYDGY